MKFLPSLLLLVWTARAQASNSTAKGQGITDLTTGVATFIKGLVKEIPKVKPSIDQLFRLPINALAGVPEVTFSETFNQICSIYMASGEIRPRITPNINEMAFVLGTACRNESFPLLEAETILDSPNFNATKKLMLYVSGWKKIAEDGSAVALAKAYYCRDDYNFLVSISILCYFNKLTRQLIPHITGLDPANPCFNEGEVLYGIQRGDAEFIDIIHSNPGVLGKKQPMGDADFYAGGLAPIKPGCIKIPCSHLRAWAIYAESVYPGNDRNFLSVQCNSLTKLEDGFCVGEAFPMGFAVPHTLKGNYFLGLNKKKPFGKNANRNGTPPNSRCGSCSF